MGVVTYQYHIHIGLFKKMLIYHIADKCQEMVVEPIDIESSNGFIVKAKKRACSR